MWSLLSFEKIKNFLIWKTLKSRSIHPIYIIPTANGLKVLTLNFLLLVIGLIYANNYVLLFNFLIFCLTLGSMFYTHYNLRGLNIVFCGVENGYAKESNVLRLSFKTTNQQGHHNLLLKAYHKSLLSYHSNFFSIKENNQLFAHEIDLCFSSRGKQQLKHVGVETTFPLGFFKAFTYYSIDCEFFCYPSRKNIDLNVFEKAIGFDHSEEETEHKKYQLGDPLKRVDWKRVAKSNKWYTKSLVGNENPKVYFSLDTQDTNLEKALEQISFDITTAEINGNEYGIKVNKQLILEASHGKTHQDECLKALTLL